MTLSSTTVTTSMSALFEGVFDGETSEVFCAGFDESQVAALVEAISEIEDPPTVRLLTSDPVVKWMREDFVLASEAAALIEAEKLSVRTTTERLENVLVMHEDAVISIVTAGEQTAGCVTDDAAFVEALTEERTETWESGEGSSLRTPGRSRVEASLNEAFSSELAADFRATLDAVGSTRSDGFNIVDVSLLVAAKHDRLLYDISKWGEDTGVASKASFSRRKTALEERGLLETEKVPIDVGRPRLRLLLPDELREATAEDLPERAYEFSVADAA